MKQEPNQAGGESIWLKPSESLADVPATHQSLITSEIRTAFAAPEEYFLALAARTPLPGFQNYLQQLVTDGRCALILATADEMFGGPSAAFQWWQPGRGDGPRNLLIEPGCSNLDGISGVAFQQLFSQVRWLHWDEIGYGGGLFRSGEYPSLQHYGATSSSKRFPVTTTRVFGSSACGDMLIYNADGEAGYMSHETGEAYSLGSITDALNWIFNELRQGRTPEFDYSRIR